MKLNHIVEAIVLSSNPYAGANSRDIENTIIFLTHYPNITNTISLKRIIKKLNSEMKKREAESIPPKTKTSSKCLNPLKQLRQIRPYNGTEWE